MTPSEIHEERQRATPPEPANFCSAYDTWEPVPAWLVWTLRVIFALALAAAFGLAGLWVTQP